MVTSMYGIASDHLKILLACVRALASHVVPTYRITDDSERAKKNFEQEKKNKGYMDSALR